MNIFITDSRPDICAQNLDNVRVNKMVLETCQLLSTAVHLNGGAGWYKPTHIHHPCTVWTATCRSNYMWLLQHFKALCAEKEHRYVLPHKCSKFIDVATAASHVLPAHPGRTDFANCAANAGLGLNFKHMPVIEAYRAYLNERWRLDKRKPAWFGRRAPEWKEPQ